jgi:hypothetical protein
MFCKEIQHNRIIKDEEVEEWFCNDPANIEELKKL